MKRFATLLALFVFAGFQLLQAQSVQITGSVTSSEDGSALPGVSIVVKGTTIGTVTDFEGNYLLSVPENASTLVFSYIGMRTQEVAIGNQTDISPALEPDVVGLDEVVVTAIGIKRAERALGYGVQTVSSESLTESGSANVVNALTAKTSGVLITNSAGDAGAATHVTIRGSASIEGNNEPLWVVDGLPINSGGGGGGVGGVSTSSRSIDLNPDDIESISVLKGGAATALYGLRAANGVIVVTTKKGTTGSALKVDFHTRVGIEKISQVPAMQRQYAQGNNGQWSGGNRLSFGPNVDTLQYDTTTDPDYKWDPNGMIVGQSHPNANGNPVQTYDQYDYFQTGMIFDNTLSVSSGNEKSTYYFSVSDLEHKGVVPNNKFGRTSIRLNAETNLTSKIKVGTNINYINSRANQIQKGSNVSGVMLGLLRSSPTFDNSAGYEFPDGTQRNYRGSGNSPGPYDNPYWTSEKNYFDENINRIMGNTTFSYNITDWINLYYNVGLDWYSRGYKDVLSVGSRDVPTGYVGEYSYNGGQFNGDLMLNFNRDLGSDINLSVTVGHNMFSDFGKWIFGDATGLSIPGFHDVQNTANQTADSYQSQYNTMAVFGDVSLGIKNMVFVNLTGRNDWSTTMPKANKSAFYPSASIGFVLTELPGLQNNNILPFAKIRASWAKTANIAGVYNTRTLYETYGTADGWTTGVGSPFLGVAGFELDESLGNADLRHETMASTEVGLDLRFYNNRLGLDVGYFYNKNTDLLLDVPIAASSGFQEVYQNAASMESKGIEITLKATPVRTSGFSWDILANFTKMKNTVLELAPGVENLFLGGFTVPQMRAVAGAEYGSMFGFDWYRDANGAMLINDDPSDNHPDGYPMPDERAMVPIGNVNPDWLLNVTNTFSYKGVALTALLDIKSGGQMYNGTRFAMNYHGTSEITAKRDVTYTPEGTIDFANTPAENIVVFDGVYGHVDAAGDPVASTTGNVTPVVLDANWWKGYGSNFGGGPSVAAIESADWVRIRELTLSYTFPSAMVGKVFKHLQIYFTGRNLFLWTPYTGVDPETNLTGNTNGQGFDYFNNPGTKSYNFGLKVSF